MLIGSHCTKWADDQHQPAAPVRPSLPLTHNNLIFRLFDLVSSPIWWEAETNTDPCLKDKADGIYLMLALFPADFLAGSSGIRVGRGIVHQKQTQGWNEPGLGFATLRNWKLEENLRNWKLEEEPIP